jgi:hypothetical protein
MTTWHLVVKVLSPRRLPLKKRKPFEAVNIQEEAADEVILVNTPN